MHSPNPANRTKEHLFQGGYLFQIASRTELYCAIHEAGSRGLRKVWGGENRIDFPVLMKSWITFCVNDQSG